jgi:hypothetical protein
MGASTDVYLVVTGTGCGCRGVFEEYKSGE